MYRLPSLPAIEATFTTRPQPAPSMGRSAARVQWNTPRKFTSTTCGKASTG